MNVDHQTEQVPAGRLRYTGRRRPAEHRDTGASDMTPAARATWGADAGPNPGAAIAGRGHGCPPICPHRRNR